MKLAEFAAETPGPRADAVSEDSMRGRSAQVDGGHSAVAQNLHGWPLRWRAGCGQIVSHPCQNMRAQKGIGGHSGDAHRIRALDSGPIPPPPNKPHKEAVTLAGRSLQFQPPVVTAHGSPRRVLEVGLAAQAEACFRQIALDAG